MPLKGNTSMATHKVNLDALIPREDFETGDTELGSTEQNIRCGDLEERQMFFRALRKPDFQRTTDNWSPEIIVELVRSFLDSELIPAVICWNSQKTGKVFVIDGAHRISALIAWIHDDYGYGTLSRKFFGDEIPTAQKKLDDKTRTLMATAVGSYQHLLSVGNTVSDKEGVETPRSLLRARAIGQKNLYVQYVRGGSDIAEKSFLTINSNQTTIDSDEMDMIKARHKPNVIATRALSRAGRGHKYWGKFEQYRDKIEELAHEDYYLLFGQFDEVVKQSPDVPRAGQPYSPEAFKMVLDMVNVFNDISPAAWKQSTNKKAVTIELADDLDGSVTVEFLNVIRTIARLVADNSYPGSLGFDPAVYSYGATGKFHPVAYIASLKFAQKLKAENKLHAFTDIRKDFEEFLVRHKSFINQLGHSKGSRLRSLESLMLMHQTIFNAYSNALRESTSISDDSIIAQLQSLQPLRGLKLDQDDFADEIVRKKPSKSVIAAGIVRDILNTRSICEVCESRLPPSSRTEEHIIRKQDEGTGELGNIGFSHPFCNTGYKERQEHLKRQDGI